jgi:hypothetical protein
MALTYCTIRRGESGAPPLSSQVVILVDPARWPWRDRRWAHLVSDVSHEELHGFAARLGLPRRIFQGDHYDVPAEVREEAIRLGAAAVDSRELVVRLRAAGLRLPPSARRTSISASKISAPSPVPAGPAPGVPGSRTPPSP